MTTPHAATPEPALILVVDDSRLLRDALCTLLRHAGYRTEAASNGREGFERAVALRPDLILSDLEMPEASGLDLLTQVRAEPTLARRPFVLLTAVSDSVTLQRAMELGADEVLAKPAPAELLLATLRSRLGQ